MKGKAVASGQERAPGSQGIGYNFYSWVSLTREIICSEEIKTKMQSK